MGGSSSIPDKRIGDLCEAIQAVDSNSRDSEAKVAALVDPVLAVRDDSVLHRRLFLPFYGEEKPDTTCPGSPFLAVCAKKEGLNIARRMVYESVDFGLEDMTGSGAPGNTAISDGKRAFILSGPYFATQGGTNGVRFVSRWLGGACSLEMYHFLVRELGYKLFEERDHFGSNVLHYAAQSYPRPEVDAAIWEALIADLKKLPAVEVAALLRGDDTTNGISVLACAAKDLCMSHNGAHERFQMIANLCMEEGILNICSKRKVVLNGEGGSGSNEFISLCTNLHPSVEAMRILAKVGIDIQGTTTDANHNGLFVLASGPCGESMWVPDLYMMACEYLGVHHPPPHSSTSPSTVFVSPYSEDIFATSTESYNHGSNAFLEAVKGGQYLMTDLFLRSVSPADRLRMLATTTTLGENAVHLCCKHFRYSNFNRSGHVLFSLIRHIADYDSIRSLVFEARDNSGNTPLDLLYASVKKNNKKQRDQDVHECCEELRYLLAVLGACLPEVGATPTYDPAVFESPLFVKINTALTSTQKKVSGDPVVDGNGIVSPVLRAWLLTPLQLDRKYEYEKREEKQLNLAKCCTSTKDAALTPDERQSDAMYYHEGVKGAPPKSSIPVRDHELSYFYRHLPLGYSSLLGVNGPALRVVASNVFASTADMAERTTAVALGPMDQTPFQVLLQRVALYTMDPHDTARCPDGGLIITQTIDSIVASRRKAALEAEELKAKKKAQAARKEKLIMASVVVVFTAWIARKMGFV